MGSTATSSELLKLGYQYGEMVNGTLDQTRNNGNVQSQTISIGSTLSLTQTYEYDALNRLSLAREMNSGVQSWQQVYGYDRFGNRSLVGGANGTTMPSVLDTQTNPAVNPATNRYSDTTHYGYDAAGNLTASGGDLYDFDGENRIVIVHDGNVNPVRYVYDGDGRRVKKVTGNGQETSVFVYNALGQMVAEYNNLPLVDENQTSYLTSDSLGTPRVITKADGSVKARHDYLPFGEEIGVGVGGRASDPNSSVDKGYVDDNVNQKFTGYERDAESALDFAQERYYSSPLGRFTSPDNFLNDTHVSAPQSWNLYAYVGNNPLKFVDPSGQKAKIISSYDAKTNTTTIKIRASFAVYGAKGQNISAADLKKNAELLKSGIEKNLGKEFTVDGQKYVMSADISVQVAGSEAEAIASGVDNIVELGDQTLAGGGSEDNIAASFGVVGENFDRMAVDISQDVNYETTYAHEFASHLMWRGGSGDPHSPIPNSLFYEYAYPGQEILQGDYERMFGQTHGSEDPPPSPGSRQTYLTRSEGSKILGSKISNFEVRRANNLVGSPAAVYQWVQKVKR